MGGGLPTFSPIRAFPVISDCVAVTVIMSGCALLYTDSPIGSGVWLGLFVAALVVSAIDEDITAALEPSQRESL